MAESLPKEETVTIEELVLSHAYEMSALVGLLEKKGILTRDELIESIMELRKSK